MWNVMKMSLHVKSGIAQFELSSLTWNWPVTPKQLRISVAGVDVLEKKPIFNEGSGTAYYCTLQKLFSLGLTFKITTSCPQIFLHTINSRKYDFGAKFPDWNGTAEAKTRRRARTLGIMIPWTSVLLHPSLISQSFTTPIPITPVRTHIQQC